MIIVQPCPVCYGHAIFVGDTSLLHMRPTLSVTETIQSKIFEFGNSATLSILDYKEEGVAITTGKGSSKNHVVKILGIFDTPFPFRDHFY